MNFWSVYLFSGALLGICEGVLVIDGDDPGSCDQSNHGDEVLVKDRENKEKVLICTKYGDAYQWMANDGSVPPGELFSPGYDCSDILDKAKEAKDGFYWIQFDSSTPKKVWCDMTTDGGGFMLIGRKNDTTTWSVPSNDDPVEPFGFPHWSSALGDAPILDFRVQMAINEDFNQTKAHWSFRLESERSLKNLMIMGQGGCGPTSPGIGNIAYVKDLQTDKVVSTNFRCSTFGGYHHPLTNFGWSMMNSCLRSPCQYGFAFHHLFQIQTDHSGAFSYSASGNTSGITHDSTAFIGCDKGKCCGCYGPLGGTGDYCSTDCVSKNGGTVANNMYTWFWVRSTLPKRVWSKCMEYKIVGDNGQVAWYKLSGGSAVPVQGRCGQNEALLNDGIVVVPDSSTAKKVPSVPGLMQYRKDDKKLYLRANKTWNVIAQEKKVIRSMFSTLQSVCSKADERLPESDWFYAPTCHGTGASSWDCKVIEKIEKMVQPKLKQFEEKIQNQSQQVTKILGTDWSNLQTYLGNLNQSLNNFKEVITGSSSSIILLGRPDFRQQIEQWLPVQRDWHLCYRASRDGWKGSTFHTNCDGLSPTVTIIRVGKYIFGAYTDASWHSAPKWFTLRKITICAYLVYDLLPTQQNIKALESNDAYRGISAVFLGGYYSSSSSSFIFSLRNKDGNTPFKASIYYTSYAIYGTSSYGPTFGNHDIYIADNANSNTNSHTYLGNAYTYPSGYSSSNSKILSGTHHFSPSEVEVFYL